MNRKTLFAALACALLVFSMLGCGTTNKLQSIQLSTSNTAETPPGTLDLQGIGGTLQVYVWGNYSSGKTKLLNDVGGVAYQIVVTADNPFAVDPGNGELYQLAAPPDTIQLSANGLLTAVTPSACTWENTAAPPLTAPAWSMVGSYSVTATYSGFTTPPVFVAVASAPGTGGSTNPTGECGPSSAQ